MLRPALPAALLAAALLPAAASAATLSTSTSPSRVDYAGGAGEQTLLAVYSGFDSDLSATAVFFNPLSGTVHATTSDADCVARPAGAGSCRARDLTRVTLGDQGDTVNVGAAGNVVEVHLGGGGDRAFTTGSRLQAYGDGGDDQLSGFSGLDLLDGGPGDDQLGPSGFGDTVIGGTGFDTVLYGGSTPVVVTLDGVADDGTAGQQQNVGADVEAVRGGDGPDDFTGNAVANSLRGGEGGDTLQGGGGADSLLGEGGDDTIRARDGVADTVDCGPGSDTVVVDVIDVVDADCETVTLPDDDGDGVRQPLDCDDTKPAIKPGATEIAGDGIDQDCSGADLPKPGGPGPIDPGPVDPAPERVDSRLLARWGLGKRATIIIQFDVRDIPSGGKVTMRCKGKGCPFKRKTAKGKRGVAKLGKHFKGAKLKPGTTLEVRVTAPGMVGKVVRYTFRSKRKLPSSTRRCLPPGASKPVAC